jgi:hypothetical protein
VPFGGVDVLLHPIAWAGWAGLLITASIDPAGQLTVVMCSSFNGQKALVVLFILVTLLVLGTVWSGWWLCSDILPGAGAEPRDRITPLHGKRKRSSLIARIYFSLCRSCLLFLPDKILKTVIGLSG